MKTPFRDLLKLYQPFNLFLAILAYALGISMARYLGISIKLDLLLEGGIFILLIMAASGALNGYFAPNFRFPKVIEDQRERNTVLRFLFITALLMLGTCAAIVFFLLYGSLLVPAAIVLIALYVIVALSVSIPPLRLIDNGFGEIAQAMLTIGLPVVIAFIFQAHYIHRMVSYYSFTLALLGLVYFLAMDFPGFGFDNKFGRQSLLVRLSWTRGITVHNLLLAFSYSLFAGASLFGIPLGISWPPLLTLPLAIYQTVMLRNIAMGLAPNWQVLIVNGSALIALAIYLLAFTFWLQ